MKTEEAYVLDFERTGTNRLPAAHSRRDGFGFVNWRAQSVFVEQENLCIAEADSRPHSGLDLKGPGAHVAPQEYFRVATSTGNLPAAPVNPRLAAPIGGFYLVRWAPDTPAVF